MVSGRNESDEVGVEIIATELRTVAAEGNNLEQFEQDFNNQVNKMYGDEEGKVEDGSSFLDTTSGGTPTKNFVPAKWLPMLADEGQYVGKGQYGNVYVVKVECDANDQPSMAVKSETKANPFAAREITAGMAFDHPNVVKFYDNDMTGGSKILMEAVPGGDLSKKYADTSLKDLSKYTLETLYGLKHIHDKGYVHADFKPDQVMLMCEDNDCHAKLGDFGFTAKGPIKKIMGTPLYFSPEMLALTQIDKPSDMWAFGVSLFEMTHKGQMPTFLNNAGSIPRLTQIMQSMYENEQFFSKHVVANPSPLDDLISGLLRVSSTNRFTVDQAIDAAETWASQYHSLNDLAAFASNDVSGRVALPSCWTACKGKCSGGRCQAQGSQSSPTCSNMQQRSTPNVGNIVPKPVVATVTNYIEVNIAVWFDILPYVRMDQDAEVFDVFAGAKESFRVGDRIIKVAGVDVSSNRNPALAVVSKLQYIYQFPITVTVWRPQKTPVGTKVQLPEKKNWLPNPQAKKWVQKTRTERVFSHYCPYPTGCYKLRTVNYWEKE